MVTFLVGDLAAQNLGQCFSAPMGYNRDQCVEQNTVIIYLKRLFLEHNDASKEAKDRIYGLTRMYRYDTSQAH